MKKQFLSLFVPLLTVFLCVLFMQHKVLAQENTLHSQDLPPIPASLSEHASGVSAVSSKIEGIWLTQKEEKNAKVKITRCSKDATKFCGQIVWLESPTYKDGTPKIDRYNTFKEKKSRPLMGLEILSGFTEVDETHWENGQIYNPEDGDTYKCEISYVVENDQEKLNLRGYVGIPLFGKTQTWIRATL